MGHNVRYLPRPGSLVELTHRTTQGRYLFRPGPLVNRRILGVMAQAQRLTSMPLHAVIVMSNHIHILASPTSVEQMADFMRHLGTNLSKEVGLVHDWRGPMFQRRYTSIAVSDEPEAQISRLRYLLSHGTKEDLVLAPGDWPGVHCVDALSSGARLVGEWIDRSALHKACKRGEALAESDVAEDVEVKLAPLPCWAHLPRERYQERIRELVDEIEREALNRHRRDGTAPRGVTWILRRHPHQRHRKEERSPTPRFHAIRTSIRQSLIAGHQAFLVAYRIAAERLRIGDHNATFPENCYPPRLPFVPTLRLEPG